MADYNAGAGRGKQGGPTRKEFVNKDNPPWVEQAKQAAKDAEDQPKLDEIYERSRTTPRYKAGGSASSRADGIAQKGKTRGTIVMCGGGMYKK